MRDSRTILGTGLLAPVKRGALGGAVGCLLLLLYFSFRNPNDILALPYAPLFMLVGALVGGAIGLVIWACSVKAGWNLSIIPRAILGATLIALAGYFIFIRGAAPARDRLYSTDRIGAEYASKNRLAVDIALSLLLMGALPGAMARPPANDKAR